MSGGGAPENTTSTNTNKSEPWGEIKPYLTDLAQETTDLYDATDPVSRVVGFSDNTLQGFGLGMQAADANTAATGAARDASMLGMGVGANGIVSGPSAYDIAGSYIGDNGQIATGLNESDTAAISAYGSPAGATDALVRSAVDPVMSSINQYAGAAGRVGSGMHDYAMARGITDAAMPIINDAQTAAMDRGTALFTDAMGRSSAEAQAGLGLFDSMREQDIGLLDSGIAAQGGITDAALKSAAIYGQIGGEEEALADAIVNAPFDQLSEETARIAMLAGMGGSSSGSTVGVAGTGGGIGFAQGLGAMTSAAALGSALFS